MSSVALPYAAIPYYGDPAGAIQDTIRSTAPFAVTRMLFTVPGDYFYYPLGLLFSLVTGAVVASRSALAVMFDPSGNQIVQTAVTGTQPAGVQYAYSWNVDTGSGYSNGFDNFDAPLPARLLVSGSQIGVQVNGQQAGDVGTLTLTVIKIPTGGEYGREGNASLQPTPLLT